MKAAFAKNNVESYITGLMTGREPVLKIRQDLPNISTVKPWDGKD